MARQTKQGSLAKYDKVIREGEIYAGFSRNVQEAVGYREGQVRKKGALITAVTEGRFCRPFRSSEGGS